MEKELYTIEDGQTLFNVIDWEDGDNILSLNIYNDLDIDEDAEDFMVGNILTTGIHLDVSQVKQLIKVLQSWVEA